MLNVNGQGQAVTKPKVLIIGWDGATFDLIEPWVKEGRLPTLARLMKEGAWGRLRSTIPAHSGPAWATFATGLLPGRHGVYYFVGPSRDSQFFRPVSADSIQGRPMWNLMSEQGKRVGVINVPLTYPTRPVNGYMVAGIFAPDAPSAFWPAELHDEVTQACGEYVVEVYGKLNRKATFDAIIEAINQRLKVTEYLMDHHPVEFLTVVFRMLDSIQHKFWADMDPHHTLHKEPGDTAIPDAILRCYQTLDTALARLIEKAGPEATVILISDHGFRGEYRRLAINKWLQDNGLLALQRGSASAFSKLFSLAKQLGLTKVLGNLMRVVGGARYRRSMAQRQNLVYRTVDWSRTKVVYGPNYGLNINLQGRDPQGIVTAAEYEALRDQLMTGLKELRDPATGLPLVNAVYRREEVYSGDAVDLAPDLVLKMAEYETNGRRWGFGLDSNPAAWQLVTLPTLRMSGDHSPDGIFLACGPNVRPGQVEGWQIADIAPTAMYAMDLSVPAGMEGVARSELFDAAYVAAHPVTFTDVDLAVETESALVTADDQASVVERRLAELGYL